MVGLGVGIEGGPGAGPECKRGLGFLLGLRQGLKMYIGERKLIGVKKW